MDNGVHILLDTAHDSFEICIALENLTATVVEQLALRCHFKWAVGAINQPDAKVPLQAGHSLTGGGLQHAVLFCTVAEAMKANDVAK